MKRLRRRIGWACIAVGLGLAASGCDEQGAGACLKTCIYGCALYCQDFHDTSSDTGAELCGSNTWMEGQSCADLGYTRDCGDNVNVLGSSGCP
jgi:hypothetical protein